MTEKPNVNESFIRWQAITIGRLSYSINLILTFSVAALGFAVTLLINEKFNPVSWQRCIFNISLVLLLDSGAFGIWCTINRLRDFRATTKITKLRDKDGKDSEVQKLRSLTNRLGSKTWGIFWCQISTFSAGIFLLVVSVAFSVGNKLK